MAHQIRITPEDIADYRRDGAVLLKGVLDADKVKLLEAGIEEAYHKDDHRQMKVRGATGKGETMISNYLGAQCPSLRALMQSGVIGEIAGRMMEAASAQLILDQIFYKTPGYIIPTAWHQDTPFLRVRGQDMVRLWLPCDASPRDLTVQIVRGSHRWNVVYNTNDGNETELYAAQDGPNAVGLGDAALPPAPDVAKYRDSFDIMSWDVEPGDALVLQGNVLHGADGRDAYDRPRRAFASLWGGPALSYHAPKGKAFPPPGGSAAAIPHGAPIGDYEDAFPVGWRASAA